MRTDGQELPAALLVEVLQHVPLSERLSSCALVCRAWAAAAVSATVNLEIQLQPLKLSTLQSFVQQHSRQLVTLCVSLPTNWELELVDAFIQNRYSFRAFAMHLQLPCEKLQQLEELDFAHIVPDLQFPAWQQQQQLQLPGGSSCSVAAAGVTASAAGADGGGNCAVATLPQLECLTLQCCLLSSSTSLLQLSRLSSVRQLRFHYIALAADEEIEQELFTDAISAVLQSMQQLLLLFMSAIQVSPSVFTLLPSCLVNLHIAEIGSEQDNNAACLPLEVTQLTALRHLSLDDVCMYACTLLQMPQLRDVELKDVDLLGTPPDAPEVYHFRLRESQVVGGVKVHPSCEVSVFLVAIGRLQHLQRLKLYSTHINDRDTAPLQLFSCLTASTCLTELDICLQGEQQPLPQGAVQRMFPAGRNFTQLQLLSIWSDLCYREVCQEASEGPQWWAIDAAGMHSILQACPNLVSLNIQSTVRPGDVSPLLQRPKSCVSLSVGGRAFDDTAAAVVAHLTQLTELKWVSSPGLTDAGLEQLTALTGLHSLGMDGMLGLSEGVSEPSTRLVFQNEQPPSRMVAISNEKADVWWQLQALCNQVPVNAGWKRRLQLQQEETEQLKQQHKQLQQRIAELEQQLAASAADGGNPAQ